MRTPISTTTLRKPLLQILLATCVFFGCSPAAVPDSDSVLTIIYTGEMRGYLEPCGCSESQLGGLPRRRSFIESLQAQLLKRAKGKANLLILDNGDIAGSVSQQERIKLDIALSAMNDMGYTAMNVGEKDLGLGLEFVKGIAQSVDFPLLSANLRSRKSGNVFAPYTIKLIDGDNRKIKIAIVGVLSEKFEDRVAGMGDTYIESPTKALRPLMGKLTEESDLIILLAHTSEDEAKEIAELFPVIDVIIVGHERDIPFIEPVKMGNTWLLNSGNRGKYIGKLEVILSPDADHPEKVRVARRKDETTPLEETIPDSKAITELLAYYQGILKTQNLLATLSKQKSKDGPIFGSSGCQECHNDEMETWRESRHAAAYQTLVKVKHEYDPECVGCHVTGIKYESGFKTYDETPHLVGVGCEDCHGPGAAHIGDTKKNLPKKGKDACVECHDIDHDPDFDFDTYWIEIMH